MVKLCSEKCLNKKVLQIFTIIVQKQLANAFTKKGESTKKLFDLLQNGIINIWNHLYMFSFR